jgi:hypothetical protein
VTPERNFALAPTIRVDRRAPSPPNDVDIIGERTPLPEAAALFVSEFSKGLRSDSNEPLVTAVEAEVPKTVFQNDGPALISGGLQESDEPVSTGRAAAIPDQQRQNSSRLRLGAIAVVLILLTLAASVFVLRSPSPTTTPVADQTRNLPTPPEPDLVKQQPVEPKFAAATTLPTPTITPVADQTSNLPTPPEPDLVKQQPAEPKFAPATTLPSPTTTPVADQTSNPLTPPEPKRVKRQPAEAKSAAAATPTDSAVARKTGPDTPPSVQAVPARSWKDALHTDLEACRDKPVFSRIACNEKARWKHCPGHWGSIDDCPSNMAGHKSP